MKCPFCGVEDTRVIDSRPADDNNSIRRRRQSDNSDNQFPTKGKVEAISLDRKSVQEEESVSIRGRRYY